jgi:ESS family glutamate:Na+ symporter
MSAMIQAFLFVAVLLVIGVALRQRVPIFRWLYIPASVIAGLVGLLVVQANRWHTAATTEQWAATLGDWPGWLIGIVFAGMLLEREPAAAGESISRVGRQGLMVWIIVLGQTGIGLLATWLLVQPFYDVPNSFGMLIETGFAGGHGTAAAMGEVFKHPTIALEGGLDLGILMATCGLVYGVVSGIVWINIGARVGWIHRRPVSDVRDADGNPQLSAIGYATISRDAIDPLLLQVLWLTLAFGIGMALQAGVAQLAAWIDTFHQSTDQLSEAQQQLSSRLTAARVLDFPLFIYTLFGGLIVRKSLGAMGLASVIDRETINRLTSAAMDILVVAAIASLNLYAVAKLLLPLFVLLVCAAIWTGVCLLVLARWILPREYWFELGLINYGMSTGTTATGFVLLRVVDPELESGAAEDYALAAPLSAPFIGGGVLTVALPLLVLQRVPIVVPTIVLLALTGLLIWIGRRWNRSVVDHADAL